MTKTQAVKSNTHYDWAIMGDLYFSVSFLLCDELLKYSTMADHVHCSNEILKSQEFHSAHANYNLIYPLIYNFKHGIEVSFKTISVLITGKNIWGHDLRKILEELENDLITKSSNKQAIKKIIQEMHPIINKYFYGRYIPGYKGKNFDVKNQAERYPYTKDKKYPVYKIKDIYEWMTRDVLQEIRRDIKKTENEFAGIIRLIDSERIFIYGRGKKFLHQ